MVRRRGRSTEGLGPAELINQLMRGSPQERWASQPLSSIEAEGGIVDSGSGTPKPNFQLRWCLSCGVADRGSLPGVGGGRRAERRMKDEGQASRGEDCWRG